MNWIMLALLFMGQSSAGTAPTSSAEDYLMGKADSPVKIEIFSDFECPVCRTFYLDTVTRLIAEYTAGNKVGIIFHEFPLPAHVSSRSAARYSLASKCLGREQRLKVIEYLYTCQAEWSYDGKIENVLSRVLNPGEMAKLRESLKDPTIEQAIDRDVALGNSKDVHSTPTFFVTMGGKEQRVTGVMAFLVLRDFIEPYLK